MVLPPSFTERLENGHLQLHPDADCGLGLSASSAVVPLDDALKNGSLLQVCAHLDTRFEKLEMLFRRLGKLASCKWCA